MKTGKQLEVIQVPTIINIFRTPNIKFISVKNIKWLFWFLFSCFFWQFSILQVFQLSAESTVLAFLVVPSTALSSSASFTSSGRWRCTPASCTSSGSRCRRTITIWESRSCCLTLHFSNVRNLFSRRESSNYFTRQL